MSDLAPLPERHIEQGVMDDAIAWLDAQLAATTTIAIGDHAGAIDVLEPGLERWEIDWSADVFRAARVRRRRADALARVAPTALLLLVFNLSMALHALLVARVFSVLFLLLIPGTLIAAAARVRPSAGAVRLAVAAASSITYLMLVGLAADLALPLFGIERPLERMPLLVLVDCTLALTLLIAARRNEPLAVLFGSRLPAPRHVALIAGLAALPLLAAFGAQAVQHGRGGGLEIYALVASGVLVVALVVTGNRLPDWFVQASLYAVSVAIVYSFTFSGDRLYGWDIQQEFQAFSSTVQAGAWHSIVDHDAYRAMLSITVLPSVLTQLSGMSGVTVFRAVYPLLFASFPVMVYVVAGRWLPRAASVAAAAFVVVQLAFAQQLPAIARQEIALVLFGVFVAVVFDDELPVGYRRIVAVLSGVALAFTHYSTAYVTSLVLLGGWVLGSAVGLASRRRLQSRVLVLPVVLAILGFTAFWNFGATRSSENVLRFTEQVAERGPEFLPSGENKSILARWLTGNAPQRISGEEYAARVDAIYDATAPWLNQYPDAAIDAYPVTDATAPQVAGAVPQVRDAQTRLLVLASQGLVALTSVGMLMFAWQRRRTRGSAFELATVGVAMLVFVAAMRVSGVAAEAYNQERAQIHAAAVLSVGLAAALAWLLTRWRTVTLAGLGGAIAVLFLASSGIAARLGGGAAPPNLTNAGDARERFSVTDAEVATAQWLAANRYPDSLVYTDRYGKLRIWAADAPIGESPLQDVLTPATLDRNAYVFASEANIVGDRARGAIGADYAVYEFPRDFLEANKAAIYSTGRTVVFR